jgi:asparagine synthase (glutamine-hydrolysing)
MKVLRQEPNSRYVHWLSLFSRYQRESLFHSDYLQNCDFQETDHFLEGIMSPYSKERPGIRAMRADLHNYLPCDILAKVDMTSMAHGLEGRSPFLDHKLVEAVCEFPYKVLHQAGLVKPLLGKTFSSFVSPAMMRRPKIGFGMPTSIWKQPRFLTLVNDLLRNPNCFCANYVRSDVIDTMLREHSSGHINHGERLWSLAFLESWGNRLTDRDRHSDRTLSQLDHSTAATSIPD